MKRPSEHVKEDESIRILRNNLPANWILRDVNPDYGIDKSLEIVENDEVTGKEILIQLKGTQKIVTNGNNWFSYSIKTNNLKYYLEKDLPVLLVVVDLCNEKCYWEFLQKHVYEVLNDKKPSWTEQETITIRMPMAQQVHNSVEQMIEIAYGGSHYLTTQKINQIPSQYLTMVKTNFEAILAKSKVANDFFNKAFQLQFEVSYLHDKEGEYEKSSEVLRKTFDSAKASGNKEATVKAGLIIAYQLNPYSENELVWNWLGKIESTVQELDNKTFNILWNGSVIECVLIKLIQQHFSLQSLALVSSQNPDFTTAYLVLQLQEKAKQIFSLELDFIEQIKKALEEKEYVLHIDFLKRLAKIQWLWVHHNSLKGNKKAIQKQLESIENTLLYTKNMADIISQDIKFSVIIDLAYLYNSIEKITLRDKAIDEAYEVAKKLEHKGFIKQIDWAKENFKTTVTISKLLDYDEKNEPKQEPTMEEEEKIIKGLLKHAGIDITNGTDELAELARIGLKDRNPERILKHCNHLFCDIVTYGPIWKMVALPETGLKILFCEKNGAIMGQSLDNLLDSFKRNHCNTCAFHSPRHESWTWTRKWQRERKIPEGMVKCLDNFFKR